MGSNKGMSQNRHGVYIKNTGAWRSTWAQSGTSISVASTRLDVDPSCPTQLKSFQAGDCETTGGTSVAALGGAIGAVCVLLIVIGIIIMVVILVQRRRKQKQFR